LGEGDELAEAALGAGVDSTVRASVTGAENSVDCGSADEDSPSIPNSDSSVCSGVGDSLSVSASRFGFAFWTVEGAE
jgi:hypothetical protein